MTNAEQISTDAPLAYSGPTWSIPATPTMQSSMTPVFAAAAPNVGPAVFAGIVTAIVAGAAWSLVVSITGLQIGYAAIGVGFAIGWIMRFVAGEGESPPLVVWAMTLTMLAMLFAEFFITRAAVGAYLVSQGDTVPLPLFADPSAMFAVAVDSIVSDPFTLGFWAFALLAAFNSTRFTAQAALPDPQLTSAR